MSKVSCFREYSGLSKRRNRAMEWLSCEHVLARCGLPRRIINGWWWLEGQVRTGRSTDNTRAARRDRALLGNRPTPGYLYDRKRGLINATTDVLALVESLRQAWDELEELRRK